MAFEMKKYWEGNPAPKPGDTRYDDYHDALMGSIGKMATPMHPPMNPPMNPGGKVFAQSSQGFEIDDGRYNPMQLLFGRMRWDKYIAPPLEHISMYVTPSSAIVFVVKNGVPTTIEDDPNMFPSDTLITQLRLLIG